MNPFFWFLALLGALLMLMGRRIILDEVGKIRRSWKFALRWLPLADFVFLVRYWGIAPRGAVVSLLGLSLVLPLSGKLTWDAHHGTPTAGKRGVQVEIFDTDTRRAMAHAHYMDQSTVLREKEERVRQLNLRLTEWYVVMESRRSKLTGAPDHEVLSFNREAASYQGLRAFVKAEVDEIAALKRKQLE